MDKTLIIVSAVVGSLGLLSAILGFSAEGTKLTLSNIVLVDDAYCYYPTNPALGLGVCAAIFLVIAQVTISVVGGCCGCCKSRSIPSETKRVVAIICAVVSWIAAAIAFGLYVEGAGWNVGNVTRTSCAVLKDGIFAAAGVLTLAAAGLGIASFVMLRRQPDDAAAGGAPKAGEQPQPAAGGVAMGQPQFPPLPQPAYGQAPPPNYPPPGMQPGYGHAAPNYPPPQPGHGQPANAQFPPPQPAQGYGSHAPNQQAPPPPQAHAEV